MTQPGGGADDALHARLATLRSGLTAVEQRISDACAAAARPRDAVTLVVVTKTYPASDVRLLASLGVREVGENRDQEAAAKAEACADLPLSWHFIGQLQTNKVRSVVRYADRVHSMDRARLVAALSEAVVRSERETPLGCLIQVALEKDVKKGEPVPEHRGGAAPAEVAQLADAVASAPGLRLDGVMAVAPLTGGYAGDPAAAFDRLAEIASTLRAAHPAATMVSAGMSGDLEHAVAAGATHVRVGSAVLGARPPLG